MAKREIHSYMEQWLKGDELAFKDVVDDYFYQMHAFAFQMIRNHEDAEELTMNAFLKLWQHKHRITYTARPDEYLFGILRREIIAHTRKRVLLTECIDHVDLEKLETVAHPETTMAELKLRYQAALWKLTPSQRAVFLMSREEQMTQQEIANQTGTSVNTVSNHMNAALKVFRKELKEYPDLLSLFILSTSSTVLVLG